MKDINQCGGCKARRERCRQPGRRPPSCEISSGPQGEERKSVSRLLFPPSKHSLSPSVFIRFPPHTHTQCHAALLADGLDLTLVGVRRKHRSHCYNSLSHPRVASPERVWTVPKPSRIQSGRANTTEQRRNYCAGRPRAGCTVYGESCKRMFDVICGGQRSTAAHRRNQR